MLRSLDAMLSPTAILSLDYVAVTKGLEAAPEEWRMDSAYRLKVVIHGDKRLYEFVAPSDASGTKLLVLSPEQTYWYSRFFGVRRLPTKPDTQPFLGLKFAAADLGGLPFSTLYSAQIKEETETSHVLNLTPKPGQSAPYARIELTITKDLSDDKHPLLSTEFEYYDKQDAKIKTETRLLYQSIGESTMPRQIRMIDHRPEGGTTTLYLLDWEILTDLPPETFTANGLMPVPAND